MKSCLRNTFALCVLIFCSTAVFGQTEQDIEKRFGKSVKVYSVDETIWMSAKYSADGQVCEMNLYPKRVSDETVYLGFPHLPQGEIKRTLDKIVPSSERGQETQLSGLTFGLGSSTSTSYDFENVMFVFRSSIRLKKANDQIEENTDVEKKEENVRNDEKKADSFPASALRNVEIISIVWKNRTCTDK